MEALLFIVVLGVVAWLVFGQKGAVRPDPIPQRKKVSVRKGGCLSGVSDPYGTHIAGMPHCFGGKSFVDFSRFRIGDSFVVEREGSNRFDRNAIKLWHDGRFVGYVPRHCNSVYAAHLDNGGSVDVRVVSINKRDPWKGVSISISKK